jgi:ribonuclease HI
MKIAIYTDGSCYPNPGPEGGWGAVITTPDTAVLACGRTALGYGSMETSKGIVTTNNRQELMGILMGLRLLEADGHHISVWSDSEWAIKSISGEYRSEKNKDLLDEIRAEIHRLGVAHCKFRHVKGHAGDPLNELADRLAGQGWAAVDELEIQDCRWEGRLIELIEFLPRPRAEADWFTSTRQPVASRTLVPYYQTIRISFT